MVLGLFEPDHRLFGESFRGQNLLRLNLSFNFATFNHGSLLNIGELLKIDLLGHLSLRVLHFRRGDHLGSRPTILLGVA